MQCAGPHDVTQPLRPSCPREYAHISVCPRMCVRPQLLLWLLVVGWSLRGLEVRWDLGEGGRTHPPGAPPPPGAAPSSY